VLLVIGLSEPAVGPSLAAAIVVLLVFHSLSITASPARSPDEAALVPASKARAPWFVRPSFSTRTLVLAAAAATLSLVAVLLAIRDTYSVPALIVWLVALVCLLLLGPSEDRLTPRHLAHWLRLPLTRQHRPELGTVLAITLVGFGMRIYSLDTIPPLFHGDEGEMGLLARRIMNGEPMPFFSTAPFWGLPYLFNYVQAGWLQIFGPTVFGLRLLSVVLGTLCIPVVYASARVGWGPVAAAAAAWLIAVGHFHVHYSRMGVIFIESALLMAIMMLLFGLAYERGRPRPLAPDTSQDVQERRPDTRAIWTLIVLAGLAAGLSQYFYFASRVVPIIAGPCLLLLWYSRRIGVWHVVLFGFTFVVIYAPLASHYLYLPDHFFGRLRDVSIFHLDYVRSTVGPNATLPSALPALIWEQLRKGLSLFVRAADDSGFYSGNIPAFDVVTAGLFWLGLGAVLARSRRYHEAALLLWFGLGLFFGSTLTMGGTSGQRLLIMVTTAYLAGGVFVVRLWQLLSGTFNRRAEWLAVPIGTTVALWLLATNFSTYFFDFANRAESGESAAMAREMLVEPDRYRVYFLTSPRFDPNHGSVRYIAYGIEATNLAQAGLADFRPPPDDGRGLLFLALDHRQADLHQVKARYPGGEERRVNAPNGRLLYISYRVPPGG
jgi:4-amino-4-deoxy-L-arabinose transferase-like glycosyltransferase